MAKEETRGVKAGSERGSYNWTESALNKKFEEYACNKLKDIEETWVQFKDVIIDIKTGRQFKATSEYFVTNPIPWKLGDNEDTPIIDKLFRDWVTSKEEGDKWVQTLYEMFAYSLLAGYPIGVCFSLLGEGRNGKTTCINLIEKFLGENNVTSADLRRLTTERFESWMLYKKLVCNIGEVEFNVLKNTGTFKRLTGQDTMKFEAKGKDGIIGKNYAKLIIAANTLPESYDKSEGFYRRWITIDFPNKFEEKSEFLKIVPDKEFENLCRKSVRLLKELLERGKFTNQGDVAERQRRYEERSNPFGMFLKECCVTGIDKEVPFWELYNVYVDYLEQRNLRKQSKIEFGKTVRNKGFIVSTPIPIGKINEKGKQISWSFIAGVDLKEDYKKGEVG